MGKMGRVNQKARWNRIIKELDNIVSTAPDMDCECGDCTVAHFIINLLDFPNNADDINPEKIRQRNEG